MEPAWHKKQLFCYQLLWVGPLVANIIWRHNKGFHLSISDSAQHVGMHRLLLQAQSSFLDGNHKKCEIICQLYIFFWSLPVVDQEKNLYVLLYLDLNVPGELRWWLILYWPLVSDMLVVVSYYGSQLLNQACNLLIDSPCKSLLQSSSSNSWHYTDKEPFHAMDLDNMLDCWPNARMLSLLQLQPCSNHIWRMSEKCSSSSSRCTCTLAHPFLILLHAQYGKLELEGLKIIFETVYFLQASKLTAT